MEYVPVAGLGRRGVYQLSETKKEKDASAVKQISLMKVTDGEPKQVCASNDKNWTENKQKSITKKAIKNKRIKTEQWHS